MCACRTCLKNPLCHHSDQTQKTKKEEEEEEN